MAISQQTLVEIVPLRVDGLNQLDLPLPLPVFDLLFAPDGLFDMLEAVSEVDDTLLEKYLNGEEITEQVMTKKTRKIFSSDFKAKVAQRAMWSQLWLLHVLSGLRIQIQRFPLWARAKDLKRG